MSDTLTFALTSDQFAARKTALAAQGVSITSDAGILDYNGVEVQYSYDGYSTLTIIVKHKPLLVPEFEVREVITKWFTHPVEAA